MLLPFVCCPVVLPGFLGGLAGVRFWDFCSTAFCCSSHSSSVPGSGGTAYPLRAFARFKPTLVPIERVKMTFISIKAGVPELFGLRVATGLGYRAVQPFGASEPYAVGRCLYLRPRDELENHRVGSFSPLSSKRQRIALDPADNGLFPTFAVEE